MSRARGSRPNIVIVHGHDLGRHFGCYGRGVSTPNVDDLARDGIRFDQCFTPSPQCSPSRASLSTGRYPHRNGMMGLAHLGWSISDPNQALPKRLRDLGYATYLFGEQHEASNPADLGYDEAHSTSWPQLARHVTSDFVSRLPAFDRGRPFFASVGFFEAHRPLDHPGYDDDSPLEVVVPGYLPDAPKVREDVAALNGRVKAVDEALGEVVEALRAAGLEEDTLLVFTTDHGIAFPRAKGTLYDSGIETVLILKGPGLGPGGRVCRDLVGNIDLYPTLLELAGGEPGEEVDGRTLWPWLDGEGPGPRTELMCEMTWHDRYAPVRGVRTTRWKYIRRFGSLPGEALYLPADVADSPSGGAFLNSDQPSPEVEELYDLRTDPDEKRNLIGDESAADIAEELRSRLDAWMEGTRDPLLEELAG